MEKAVPQKQLIVVEIEVVSDVECCYNVKEDEIKRKSIRSSKM